MQYLCKVYLCLITIQLIVACIKISHALIATHVMIINGRTIAFRWMATNFSSYHLTFETNYSSSDCIECIQSHKCIFCHARTSTTPSPQFVSCGLLFYFIIIKNKRLTNSLSFWLTGMEKFVTYAYSQLCFVSFLPFPSPLNHRWGTPNNNKN